MIVAVVVVVVESDYFVEDDEMVMRLGGVVVAVLNRVMIEFDGVDDVVTLEALMVMIHFVVVVDLLVVDETVDSVLKKK